MGKFFYVLFLKLYSLGVAIASLFNLKARLWIEGRRNIFSTITSQLSCENSYQVWIHCSSLGEFEQGRPLIEALKKSYPQNSIILSFFSPSGYEHQKNFKGADHIFYLPIDSKTNAETFFNIV